MAYDGFYSDLSTRGTSSDLLTQAKSVSAEIVDLASSVLLNTERVLASVNQANSSAVNSKNSADLAKVSELAAAVSAVNAGVSAANAKTSETIANNAVSPFLGALPTVPTTRRDGSPLQAGDTYLNTSTGLEYIYRSGAWVVRNLDGALLSTPIGSSLIGRNMPILTKMSDLLAYSKTSTAKQVYLSGYYTHGDVNIGVYSLDESDTTSASNGGTVVVANDGGRWKLSYNGVLNVKWFGAKGDGVQDDSPFIQKAVNTGSVFFPKGDYKVVTSIQLPAANMKLYGEGRGSKLFTSAGSILVWPTSVYSNSVQVVQSVQGLMFEHTGTDGIMLKIHQTWDPAAKVGPEVHGCFFNITSSSADSVLCISLRGLWSGMAYNNYFLGINRKGFGIFFNIDTDMNTSVMNFLIQGNIMCLMGTNINIPVRNGSGRVEGIKIVTNNMIAGMKGVSTSQCLASSIVGNQIDDMLDIGIHSVADFDMTISCNCSITAANAGILIQAASYGFAERITITGNAVGSQTGTAIKVSNTVADGFIRGLTISSNSLMGSKTVSKGISIEGDKSVLSINLLGNINSYCLIGIYISPVAGHRDINNDGNAFWECATKVSDASFHITRGKRVWSNTLIKAIAGGSATETMNIPIPVGYFSSKPLAAFASCPVTLLTGYYDYDASTTTNLVFTVRAADGSALVAGNRRFGILVSGLEF